MRSGRKTSVLTNPALSSKFTEEGTRIATADEQRIEASFWALSKVKDLKFHRTSGSLCTFRRKTTKRPNDKVVIRPVAKPLLQLLS